MYFCGITPSLGFPPIPVPPPHLNLLRLLFWIQAEHAKGAGWNGHGVVLHVAPILEGSDLQPGASPFGTRLPRFGRHPPKKINPSNPTTGTNDKPICMRPPPHS